VLVKRDRDQLAAEIGQFFVIEADGNILGTAALYPFPDRKTAELAALAVNPFYRDGGRGERLLANGEARAKAMGLKSIFVLSTRTTHWFLERGFVEAETAWLPERKAALYNYDRRSKIFRKDI
jgi:amino-acid N-acetyltransferase